jgi:hypothetical protein
VNKGCVTAIAVSILSCLQCRARPSPTELRELNLQVAPVTIAPMQTALELSWIAPDGHRSPVVESWNITVQPAKLATVVGGKALRCERTGDGVVTAQVRGRSANARFKCLLAYTLGLGRERPLRVPLGSLPQDAGIFAIRNGGVVDEQVVVTVTSDSPEVLAVEANRLVPKKLGRARITGTALGPLENSWVFEVVRPVGYWRVLAGFVPLSLELGAGNYELTSTCTENKRLTARWLRAPQCNYDVVATTHRAPCRLDVPSRLLVTPARGSDSSPDALELVELPP